MTHKRPCDTRNREDKSAFVKFVGNVVAVNSALYTANFFHSLKYAVDYSVGSNFFSVNVVKNSIENPDKIYVFPKRGKFPLFHVERGLLREDFLLLSNVNHYLSTDNLRCSFAIWLCRNKDIDPKDIFTSVRSILLSTYSGQLVEQLNLHESQFSKLDINAFDSCPAKIEQHDLIRQNKIELHKSVDDLPLQQIFFGAPGTGKSYGINCNACITDGNSIRTTFHPDCDYSTFVGCYKPTVDEASGDITYRFTPQAFTEAYVRAWSKLDEPFFLIIEEINRGNCAQIFGDVFQLLDRDDRGYSAYRITPDTDLRHYLEERLADADIDDAGIKSGEKMQLPPNLHIWATMNTSDQSLFPIDSAFKRRWDWRYVPIDCTDRGHYIDCGESGRYVWASFVRQANERIEAATQSEDKKLGYWFAARKGHEAISADRFVSKVVFYLWNDVFRDCAGEAGSMFTGSCDSFHRFFTNGGEVDAGLVAEFLDGLGVERCKPDAGPQPDAEQ